MISLAGLVLLSAVLWGHGMPLQSNLDVLRSILVEYGLVATPDSPVHSYFNAHVIFREALLGIGKYIMSRLLDPARLFYRMVSRKLKLRPSS